MNLVTIAQMREIDRIAIQDRGIPAADLMERAGRGVAEGMADLIEPGPVLVLCGKGNNGGDGFVAARYLAQSGFKVTVVPVLGTSGFSPETQKAFDELKALNVEIIDLPTEENFLPVLINADAVLDAMLGTGSRPELSAPMNWIVQAVNASHLPVLAADMPTGMDADSGETVDLAIKATMTVTIGLPKIGMMTANGVIHCGQIRVEPIQFPRDLLESPDFRYRTIKLPDVATLLPKRPLDANKGTFGTVTICAGSRMMPGAATLCASGALRSGAGLVRLHAPSSIIDQTVSSLPEVILSTDSEKFSTSLIPLTESERDEVFGSSDALVIGPGIGQDESCKDFIEQALSFKDKPTLLDADALNLIAKHSDLSKMLHANCVLTPHPGELARLMGVSVKEIQQNRWEFAQKAQEHFGCTVVLKGYGTLIATPQNEVIHIPSGNTALAQGGAGDVLSGVIGGLLAQGCKPQIASVLGTFTCGLAADILVREQSPRGLTISDILKAMPLAFRELEDSLRPGGRIL